MKVLAAQVGPFCKARLYIVKHCNDSLTGAVSIMESSRVFPNFIY